MLFVLMTHPESGRALRVWVWGRLRGACLLWGRRTVTGSEARVHTSPGAGDCGWACVRAQGPGAMFPQPALPPQRPPCVWHGFGWMCRLGPQCYGVCCLPPCPGCRGQGACRSSGMPCGPGRGPDPGKSPQQKPRSPRLRPRGRTRSRPLCCPLR